MKRIVRILLALFAVFILAVAGLLAYVSWFLPDVGPAPDMVVEVTPERVARGNYLANHVMVCMDCHAVRDWSRFSGPPHPETLGAGGDVFDQSMGFPGRFISKNLTPYGLGDWTDGEIFRAITTGVNRHGKAFFPVMPYPFYGQLDEEDIKAVIAYIRTLPPIENQIEDSKPDFPFNFILNTIPQKPAFQKMPDPSDPIAYGAYVTKAAACAECHTKQEKGKVIGAYLAGGFEFDFGNGSVVRSVNLTPHPTGLGSWSKEQFIARFKAFEDPGYELPPTDMARRDFQTVMPWTMYAGMTEEDLGAIYDYLRTVPPVENVVERFTVYD